MSRQFFSTDARRSKLCSSSCISITRSKWLVTTMRASSPKFTITITQPALINPFHLLIDNSGENVTFWLKPAVKEEGVKLTLGDHPFFYVAFDAFQNKAMCEFIVTVLDVVPPTIENCIDPLEMYVPLHVNALDNRSFIDWDPPMIFDNSEEEVIVIQSIVPGFLGIGIHTASYTATDSSGNQNTCSINITVKAIECDIPAAPLNGDIVCAQNVSHTWCDVACNNGYTIYNNDLDLLRLVCEHNNPFWQYSPIPDCTQIEQPESIEQIVEISLPNDMDICPNSNNTDTAIMFDTIKAEIRQIMCNTSIDTSCHIVSEIPNCSEPNTHDQASADNFLDRNFYRIAKRSTVESKNPSNFKFRIYTRISKGLGLWNSSLSRIENMGIVKDELKTYHTNEKLRNRLHDLRINVKHLNLEDNLLCKDGSVLKNAACGEY